MCRSFLSVCFLFSLVFLGGCSSSPTTSPEERHDYDLKGKVVSVDVVAKSVKIDHEEIPGFMKAMTMPPTITLEQAKGFSLFMLKAVFNGRGDEVIDLAKTNLFR